jgi:peroxiredoxin Q/BCP
MPETGEMAPDFTLPRDGGGEITLSALRPKAVVLYFYPKDDTSGCTKEAIAFTGLAAEFEAAGAVSSACPRTASPSMTSSSPSTIWA